MVKTITHYHRRTDGQREGQTCTLKQNNIHLCLTYCVCVQPRTEVVLVITWVKIKKNLSYIIQYSFNWLIRVIDKKWYNLYRCEWWMNVRTAETESSLFINLLNGYSEMIALIIQNPWATEPPNSFSQILTKRNKIIKIDQLMQSLIGLTHLKLFISWSKW